MKWPRYATLTPWLAALGFLVSPCVAGQPATVRTLLVTCQAKLTAQRGWCAGYISGIADAMTETGFGINTSFPRPEDSICPHSEDTDTTIVIPIFLNWAEHHPEQWDFPANDGVARALQTKWPCKTSK